MNSHKGVRITIKKELNKSLRMWAGKRQKMCYIILEHPLIICFRIDFTTIIYRQNIAL